jgi:SET domain-containing protein
MVRKFLIERTVGGEYRIGLFALRDIAPETELTYDYRFESFGPLQKCLCGSENCRGLTRNIKLKDLSD